MYKSYTAADFKRQYSFPSNYSVSGVISCGTAKSIEWRELFEEQLGLANKSFTLRNFSNFFSDVNEYTINGKVYWFICVYGSAKLSEYLHIGCLFGSKGNIHLGSCGGVYKELNACDLIVPSFSYDPSTSVSMYTDFPKVYPNEELSKQLAELVSTNHTVYFGPIMTCQGMLGETLEDIKKWSKDDYYGVEMETATVFAVSNHFNVKSAAITYVSDNLIKEESVLSDHHLQQKELRNSAKKELARVVIKLLVS